ncbi:ABC transporter permease [Agromyces sp. NPDC060279]|uniref:ABC transporter permease n=1 Tax=Agromyces sp. NPDC060279 TaxID=3347092 RepID=UPI00364A5276
MTAETTTAEAPEPTTGRRPPEWRRFLASGQVRWGAGLLLFITAFAALGGILAPFDPAEPVGLPYEDPGGAHPLGTDKLGRDVLSRVLAGGVHLAWMAPVSTVIAVLLGAFVGMLAAYYGGVVDALLSRTLDVLLAFPGILLTLLCVAMFGPQTWLLVALVALALFPGVARVMRGTTSAVIGREYISWAKAVGTPGIVIIAREILPNITSPLLVELGIRLMWSVGILASMSFLGYGIQPPAADWGLMVSENRDGLANQPFAVVAPMLMIVLYTVAGNLIAEGSARVLGRTEGRK